MAGMAKETTMFKLKDNLTIESLDSVPDDFKPIYGEDEAGGGFRVRPEFSGLAGAIASIQGSLVSSREAERKGREFAEQAQAWGALGESPDAVKAQLDELQKKLEGASGSAEDLERFKQEFQGQHKAALEARDKALAESKAALEQMQSSLHNHLVVSTASQAIATAKGYPEMLMPLIQSHTRVVQNEQGQHVVQVLDDDGQPRFNGASMQPMTIGEYVSELKQSEVWGRAFQPTGTSGGGAQPNGKVPPRQMHQGSEETKTAKDKIAVGMAARQGRR
jgi:hypothetical protein